MRFRKDTIDAIDTLTELSGIPNKTHVVSQSIKLALWVLQAIDEGNELRLVKPDGEEKHVLVVGF